MLTVNNLTSNINRVALAILALLEGEVPVPHNIEWEDGFEDRFDIETSTFYNGRENGICLTARNGYSANRLVIVFGENRNSDSIFVQKWTEHSGINPPVPNSLADEAYENRKYFNYDRIIPAVEYIQGLIVEYCNSFAEEAN